MELKTILEIIMGVAEAAATFFQSITEIISKLLR